MEKRRLTTQAIHFVIVGIAAATVHFVSLVGWVQWGKVSPVYANVLAFLLAFCVSFSGHYYLTFQSQNKHSFRSSLGRWFVTSIGGFTLNQLIFLVGIYYLGIEWYRIVWIFATGLVIVITFILGKFWAFSHKVR